MKFVQDTKVLVSSTDFTVGIGLVGATAFLQDNMCDYFKKLGCDGITMIPICKAFFVITKTKFKFRKQLKWNDEISLQTGVSNVSKIRVNLMNNVAFRNGEIAIEGIQELCPIDSENRRLRTVESTLFPSDIKTCSSGSDLIFSKLNFNKNEFEFKKSIEINLSNVDYYLHTNNVEYVKFCMSVLGMEVFENKSIDTFEIHYIKESIIGTKLDMFVNKNDNVFDFLILSNNEIIAKAEMVLRDNNI